MLISHSDGLRTREKNKCKKNELSQAGWEERRMDSIYLTSLLSSSIWLKIRDASKIRIHFPFFYISFPPSWWRINHHERKLVYSRSFSTDIGMAHSAETREHSKVFIFVIFQFNYSRFEVANAASESIWQSSCTWVRNENKRIKFDWGRFVVVVILGADHQITFQLGRRYTGCGCVATSSHVRVPEIFVVWMNCDTRSTERMGLCSTHIITYHKYRNARFQADNYWLSIRRIHTEWHCSKYVSIIET